MRQEDKFILELLMPNTDWSSNEKLNNTLDWDYIIHHCTQHKLLPVLYNRRVFDDDRKNEALLSFYNDYINKVLFSGSYFKVIDISAEDRFDEE